MTHFLSTVFVRNQKRPTGSPRRRWQDDIKADLKYIGLFAADWWREAQDREDLQTVRTPMVHYQFG
jgi:hypothetical protein